MSLGQFNIVTVENEDSRDRVKARRHERASHVFEELCMVDVHEVGSGQR